MCAVISLFKQHHIFLISMMSGLWPLLPMRSEKNIQTSSFCAQTDHYRPPFLEGTRGSCAAALLCFGWQKLKRLYNIPFSSRFTLYLIMQHVCETRAPTTAVAAAKLRPYKQQNTLQIIPDALLAKGNSPSSQQAWGGDMWRWSWRGRRREQANSQNNRNKLTFNNSFSVFSPRPPPSTKKHTTRGQNKQIIWVKGD